MTLSHSGSKQSGYRAQKTEARKPKNSQRKEKTASLRSVVSSGGT
mgnify:CR=1 FL=1|jgi:hypothetical protein